MRPAFALIGAAALGAALFLAGYAAALLDDRPKKPERDAMRREIKRYAGTDRLSFRPLDDPLRWSDTGEAVETYQTFTLPNTSTVNAAKPVKLRSVG